MMKTGDQFRQEFIVSKKEYETFLTVFNDQNPMHTSSSYARSKGFRDRIMHGNILNGYLSFFVGEQLPTKEVVIISQSINYNLPFYLGDNLELNAQIKTIHVSVGIIDIKYKFRKSIEHIVADGLIQIKMIK